ncbi:MULTISPECIES: hypothetical protein [Chryseobacterium]|uniref:hypothetical protein n=1 Tax=Chryseobacterium TaxID=59732 RepID=UPI0021D3F3AA|nr:hypothetical protein [Chryseobacterium timonianum]
MGKSSRDNTKTVLASLIPGSRSHTLNVGLFSLKISQSSYQLMKSLYQMESFTLFLLQKEQKVEKVVLQTLLKPPRAIHL